MKHLSVLASSDSGIHISLKAEEVFKVGPVSVSNSMLYGFVIAGVISLVTVLAASRSKINPSKSKLAAIFELLVDYLIGLMTSVFGGKREYAIKYAPYFGTFFILIMLNNLSGLLPIVGPGLHIVHNGIETPLFRPLTADLNGTIAMSVIAIIMVQYLSIKEQGLKSHMTHYFTNKPFNPINFFIGILEVVGEFTRVLSLSLRLFLNTAVGEILISVFTSLILKNGQTPLAVIPIIIFEILVAGIQAYVFTILASTYLSLALSHHIEHQSHHESQGRGDEKIVGV